jgi:glucose/arabinose dehydrogenase
MRRRFGRGAVATGAAGLLALAVALGAGGASAQSGALHLKKFANLKHPVYVGSAPDTSGLLFVVDQTGTVEVFRKGKRQNEPFLNLRGRVKWDRSEQGMYSIAFDPDYKQNRLFYVYFINNDGNIEVDQLKRSKGSAVRADANSRRTVIEIPHPNDVFHNGGQLQFGADGFLYIGTGDGEADTNQPPDGNAQSTKVLLGKILRVAPKPNGGYDIPDSNPFAHGGGDPEIYALGIRQPFRFSFDKETGDFWAADVGQDKWEEIDHVNAADLRGANFGWDLFEGTHNYNGDGTEPPNYVPPVLEYSSLDNQYCAILGGIVVRNSKLPSLDGRYVYSDLCAGELRSLNPSDPIGSDTAIGVTVVSPTSFGADNRGRLYATSLNGGVYRVVEG